MEILVRIVVKPCFWLKADIYVFDSPAIEIKITLKPVQGLVMTSASDFRILVFKFFLVTCVFVLTSFYLVHGRNPRNEKQNLSRQKLNRNKRKQVFFLKTSKTGSTTVAGIISRFAYAHPDLNVLLPVKNTETFFFDNERPFNLEETCYLGLRLKIDRISLLIDVLV